MFQILVSFAIAHSGRTDASGCHNDNIHGGYHCHNSGSTSYSDFEYRDYIERLKDRSILERSEFEDAISSEDNLDYAHASNKADEYTEKIKECSQVSISMGQDLLAAQSIVKQLLIQLDVVKNIVVSLTAQYNQQKDVLEKQLQDVESKRRDVLAEKEELNYFKLQVEKERQELDLWLKETKQQLYRQESNDICGKIAVNIYDKYRKKSEFNRDDLELFVSNNGFYEKCERLKFDKLIIPALVDHKCGRYAKLIYQAYSSNEEYYDSELYRAVEHFEFYSKCPGISFMELLDEVNYNNK